MVRERFDNLPMRSLGLRPGEHRKKLDLGLFNYTPMSFIKSSLGGLGPLN